MASLPYPRGPLIYPPTEATELAEVSGGEEPPTMCLWEGSNEKRAWRNAMPSYECFQWVH